MSDIEKLIREALSKFSKPYGVDIIDEVLGKIQNTPDFLGRYYLVLADYAFRGRSDPEGIANRYIGRRVKQITGLPTLNSDVPCKKNTLAKTYTQLG